MEYFKQTKWEMVDQRGDRILFEFDADEMDVRDMFFKWVDFMSACGYVLDKAEMEAMWNGE